MSTCEITKVFRFKDLVLDVQIYIITLFVSPQDLLSLTFVSQHIHSLATPALYSDAKLLFGPKLSLQSSHVCREKLLFSQRAFTTQIFNQRARGRDVRRLSWQMCGSCNPSGNTFTELFPLLKKVTQIHLLDAHPTHICERTPFLRPSARLTAATVPLLFPRVQDIKLSGTISLPFVMPILHSPHRLTSLSFDTVNPHSVALQFLQWINTADLSNLRSLSLRALSQPPSIRPWNDSHWQELLSAWREALSATRQTLEEVTLGFKEQLNVTHSVPQPPMGPFAQIVMPVFWVEDWPRLKTLCLEGIDIGGVALAPSVAQFRAAIPGAVVNPTARSSLKDCHSKLQLKSLSTQPASGRQ